MTDINIPLLRKVVEWVEEQEALEVGKREWRQVMWLTKSNWCGTQACVAGKVALLEGWKPVFDGHDETGTVSKDGVVDDVANVALRALGVDERYLFGANNTATDVRREAERLAGEPL